MPIPAVLAADTGLPNSNPTEPAFELTPGGVAAYLLETILDRLHVDNRVATFAMTDDLADALAMWRAADEDMEEDDAIEEDTPGEDGHDNEADAWFVEA